MANDVFANGREISCKAADGKSICAFPDVCLSPPSPPAGPVPIPYPNTGFATDTTSGSKTVKISGKEVMLKDKSYFKKSTGDEAATKSLGMGVVTHQLQGKVYFNSWSMNVKFEGENVVRHLDLTTHNHASQGPNTPPWPYSDSMSLPSADPNCEVAGAMVKAGNERLPEHVKEDKYVIAGAKYVPAPGEFSTPVAVGVSGGALSPSQIVIGGKYSGFAKGIKRGQTSNVPCPSNPAGVHTYSKKGRPKEGHAEAKIIEDLFKVAKPGTPKGTLYLKVVGEPICDDCKSLIKCAEETGLKVLECP
jgi:hypothetical protein